MEKFAVDLEKVLDDFEYSEEQLHDYSSEQRNVNSNYSCNYTIYPQHCRPPASNYRRPPFEPVNLADADFSVSAGSPSIQVQSDYSSSSNYSDCSNYEASVITSDDVSSNPNDNSYVYSFKTKDFKPDLIESNVDICPNSNEFDRFERHLPDIASADVDMKDEKVNFDLINNSASRNVDFRPEPGTQEIIRFPTTSELSESELHQYLEELEEREYGGADVMSNDSEIVDEFHYENQRKYSSNEIDDNKISIQVMPDSEQYKYLEKSEVEVKEEGTNTHFSDDESPTEGGEKVILSLNIGNSAIPQEPSELSSNSEEVRTESSVLEVTQSVDEVSTINDGVDDRISVEEVHSLSEIGLTDSSSPESIAEGESESLTSEVEESVDDRREVGEPQASEMLRSCPRTLADNYQNEDFRHSETTVEHEHELSVEKVESDSGRLVETEKPQIEDVNCVNEMVGAEKMRSICDGATSVSDSNYRVLDSKTAISTLESVVEDRGRPGPSKHQEDTRNETSENADTQSRLQRPDSLDLTHTIQNSEMSSTSADSGSLLSIEERRIGKEAPVWIPDSETAVCMHCRMKFTLVKRRHHCRACGLVLCSKCCDVKASLEYLGFEEARVCHTCHSIIERINNLEAEISSLKRPNPNNPMEYCSTISPLLQVGPTQPNPPSVLVPVVGVLKRGGRAKTNDTPKQVIFSDGIRPGGDLTELDVPSEPRLPLRRTRITKRVGTPPGNMPHRRLLNPETHSFIPSSPDLPPLVNKIQGDFVYTELDKPLTVEDEPVKFAVNRNLHVIVKRILLDCCVNRDVWCMTTDGLSCVGQDEVVFILEVLPDEKYPPKDVFWVVNMLYQEASKGSTVTEMSFASPYLNQLFGSKEHGGFVFIRPTYQCVQKLLLPKPPFLIAILIHRWEAPWARLFPIRLVLRLGAEFRYYPCPLVSIRNRPALFTDLGHTIISLLADFRKYSYSLPTVRGLMVHMEDRLTTILLPRNRYDQVIRAMNNSEENVLAFAGNISMIADSHLVCMQSTQDDTSYHTQAINIHNKPRQVTGASFIVFNGSLKQCAWAGKSNIVEDGLMVQIPSESMTSLRAALRQMNDYSIGCGPQAEEVVVLKWVADDVNFNIGVKSNIDNRELDGVPSIRVHNGTDYSRSLRLIRWTEVFILQSDEETGNKTGDTVNISKLSESIARATCVALVPLLDLLATANLTTLAVRATIHPENVGYEAGSRGEKLPPLYMKSLDEELIAVVHEAAVSIRDISCPIVLELIFKVMEQG